MATLPYRDARHVFWIVDNGSSHRGQLPSNACRRRSPISCSSTARSMRAGSTRSRSTSPSSSGRR
jgi:hypothetical protein